MKRNKHTKAEEWSPLIEAWKKSGLTKKHFCQQSNISYKTFYRWYYKLHRPELNTTILDKSTTPYFADFISVTMNKADKKAAPKPEQHCILLFNDQLQMQIPVEVMTTDFLQMLMAASRASLC